MLIPKPYLALAGLALLSACDAPAGRDHATAAQEPTFSNARLDPGSEAQPSNRYSRELFEMDPQMRRVMFRKFMTTSGEQCDLVTEAVLRGGHKGMDMWRIACSDSGEWMVSIEPDSSTKILSCSTMKALGDDCHAILKR